LTSAQVQTKKLQEKEQAKRHAVDSVTQWRKDRKSGRIQGGLMFSSAGIAHDEAPSVAMFMAATARAFV
jgi:hypothetical protein